MRTHPLSPLLLALGLALPLGSSLAQEAAPGIVGQNQWLYYRHEYATAADQPGVNATVALLRKVNRQLEANGVRLVVAMAPLKIRIHPENLPASAALDAGLKSQYERILNSLRDGGVRVADLNTAFLNSPNRTSPMPLYFRQDTHWSSSGALLAAETIAKALQADPTLKPLVDALPATAYTLTWSPKDWPVAGDLTTQLPKGSPSYDKELIKIFQVEKAGGNAGGGGLLGNTPVPGITLLGSSYSADWTNFPVAMRYALQRDILSISVDALRGQWVGLHTYLRDDAFQTSRPKILIWEMPERDMRSPPDMKYRDPQYVMDNTEWLLQTAALIQERCTPSAVKFKIDSKGMKNGQAAETKASASGTGAEDFVELSFDKPLERLDYLSARLTTAGSTTVVLEGSGPGVPTRKFNVKVAGDDADHALRLPAFPSSGKGFTKLRLYPGKTQAFALQDTQVCRLPDELLAP